MSDNLFFDAMPRMHSKSEFEQAIGNQPRLPVGLAQMSNTERRQVISVLGDIFIPMDYMYLIYDQLYRAIQTSYHNNPSFDRVRRINDLAFGRKVSISQAESSSILGVPGIGKTSTIRRCLITMPQVIEHTEPELCKQVLYLRVETPADCSVKTLVFNIVAALDKAVGSDYLKQLTSWRSVATSALATQVKILMRTHNVGLLVVDEIQNAVNTARRNNQTKPLVKFLVELTNDTATSMLFVGTPEAEQLFTSQEHLKRRTRGLRLLPLKPDGTYRRFLEELWRYQLTREFAPLTDRLANVLYDLSGGIPAYLLKIFREAQGMALIQSNTCISEQLIRQTVQNLAIKVPRTYAGGTYISDFEGLPGSVSEVAEGVEMSRLYANKRGRKQIQREDSDLIAAFEAGGELVEHLRRYELLEETRC